MSDIKELIERLCPDGVEYKKLGEVCVMQRGTSMTKKNAVEGDIPVISGGREPAFYINQSNREGETITVAGSGAGAGYVQYWNEPIFVNDAFSVKGSDELLTKYVYYCMKNMQEQITGTQKGGGVPHVHISSIDNFEIPVPPIEVQRKIVEILDNFTELEAELERKLEAELEARRKQYEYYRNALLSFDEADDNVKWMTLGEIAEIGTGSSNTNEELEKGKYPFFVRSQVVRYKNEYEYDETAIITSGDGVGVGKVFHYVEGKYALHQRAYRIKMNNDNVNSKFFYYYMRTTFYNYIMKNAYSSSVTSVRRPMLIKFPVPIPPLSEQQRIVDILDRFEALTTDLQSGLPAEIEARRKQYEYYREKLLTFKRNTKVKLNWSRN